MQDTDPVEIVRAHFDQFAEGEWDRLVQSPRTLVSLELHRRLLTRFVHAGDRVLEIGAGPGRFTIELAKLGATVVVSDVSPVQLRLNRDKVTDAGREDAVEDRLLIDVRDLSAFEDASFDAVVAYGGPISYAFKRAEAALGECLRVTRPGGVVAASVMTTLGSMRLSPPHRRRRDRHLWHRGHRGRAPHRRSPAHTRQRHPPVPDVQMARAAGHVRPAALHPPRRVGVQRRLRGRPRRTRTTGRER